MNEQSPIRASFFGGFNRKDVSEYIEKIAQKSAEYQAENEKLHERCRELEDYRQKYNHLSSECEALKAENAHLLATNTTLTDELSSARENIDAFNIAKDRLASLELEASRRALELEKEAKLRAEKILSDAGSCVAEIQASIESINRDALLVKQAFAANVDAVGLKIDELVSSSRDRQVFLSSLISTEE